MSKDCQGDTEHSLLRNRVNLPPPGEQWPVCVANDELWALVSKNFGEKKKKKRILEGLNLHLQCVMTFPNDRCMVSQNHTWIEDPLVVRDGPMGISEAVGNAQCKDDRPCLAANG